MTYPAEELQKSLYEKISNDPGLHAAMGGVSRVYDSVPENHAFPYITGIGDGQFVDFSDNCEHDRYTVYQTFQVWSRAVGEIEAKRIAGALRASILSGFPIDGWILKLIDFKSIDHVKDPDGLTSRARVNFEFIIEPS